MKTARMRGPFSFERSRRCGEGAAGFGRRKIRSQQAAPLSIHDEFKLADKKDNVLPDVRLLPERSTAKELAGTVHADLAKGFLYAVDARTKQRIGADHKLKNGEVIKIVSAASRG